MSEPRREGLPAMTPTLQTLMEAVHADPELRAVFKKLISIPEQKRLPLLTRMIEAAGARAAPGEFQQALLALRDPVVLKKLGQLL